MNKNVLKLALAGTMVFTTVFATEIRTPWISENGPIRYTFERLKKNENKYNLNIWSAAHAKEAHKAFLKHGTNTVPLSALIFNKSEFNIREIFPDSKVPLDTEEFSPFLSAGKLEPRVNYFEWGVTFGARFDYPVWNNKGRIGLRATVPFRSIEMEREDITDKNDDPLKEYISSAVVTVDQPSDGGAAAPDGTASVLCTAYRMDLVNGLPVSQIDRRSLLVGANGAMNFSGTNLAKGVSNDAEVGLAKTDLGTDRPYVHAFMRRNAGTRVSQSHFLANDMRTIAGAFTGNLPDDLHIGFFQTGEDYRNTFGTAVYENTRDKYWLIFRRQTDTPSGQKFGNGTVDRAGFGEFVATRIEELLKLYDEHPLAFFDRNGFEFETQKRTGLGDIDIDLFYEHTFNKEWIGELMLGLRLPTGGDQDKYGNPYKAMTGNGEHFEIKLGGLVAYQPLDWMNIKLDLKYSFVLEGTEHRMAAFKGAQIKNIGPRADADVSWGYFVGHLDFTFFHPKTSKIRSTIGYELYYKTEDHLTYKRKEIESWLGRVWNPATAVFDANPQELDNNLARKNTESVGHKLRGETSFQVHKYFEIFAGGSYTFAGQNVMRDRDCHGGFNVRF